MEPRKSITRKFQEYDYLLKLILIGDPSVGKSSLLLRYVDNSFEDAYICTIGVDFKIKTLDISGKRVKLQIWDTAGQERFRPITNCYYRGSHGCLAVYDVTRRESFTNVRSWVDEYRDLNTEFGQSVMIVGNKCDITTGRQVSVEEGKRLASDVEGIHMECSARSGLNVEEMFKELTMMVMRNVKHEQLVGKEPGRFNFKGQSLEKEAQLPQKKKSSCC